MGWGVRVNSPANGGGATGLLKSGVCAGHAHVYILKSAQSKDAVFSQSFWACARMVLLVAGVLTPGCSWLLKANDRLVLATLYTFPYIIHFLDLDFQSIASLSLNIVCS